MLCIFITVINLQGIHSVKDEFDKSTPDLLAKPKRSPGRPTKLASGKMEPKEAMAAMRYRITLAIENGSPSSWDEKTCLEAMKLKKYQAYRELAWKRYGELNGFNAE